MYSLLFHNFFHWNWSLRVPSKDKSWSFKGAKTFFFSTMAMIIIMQLDHKHYWEEGEYVFDHRWRSEYFAKPGLICNTRNVKKVYSLSDGWLSLSLSSKVVSISEEIETLMCTLNFFQDFLGSPSSLSFLTGRSSWMSAYSGQVFKIHSRISWKLVLLPNTALDENFPETVTLHTHQCVRNQWPRYC